MLNDVTSERDETQSDNQAQAAALAAKGNEILLHGTRAAEAAGTFSQALQLDPTLLAAHLGMAEANFALGQNEVTRMAAEYVQRLAPGTVDAAIAQALLLCLTQDYPQAQTILDEAAQREPGRAYLHALRGYVLRCLGNDYDAALAEAKAARLASSVDLRSLFPRVQRYASDVATNGDGAAPRLDPVRPPQPQMSPRTYAERRTTQLRFATRGYPLATYGIIAACVLVYLLQLSSGNVTAAFEQNNTAIAHGEWWRLLSVMFLHDPTDFFHLFTNMLSLFFIGPFVERVYGTGRFLVLYFATGLVASLTFFFAVPGGQAVGASGAIAGIFGVLGAFFFAYRQQLGRVGNAMIQQWLFWLGLNVVINFFAASSLAWQAHLGGLVAGLILGFVLVPKRVNA